MSNIAMKKKSYLSRREFLKVTAGVVGTVATTSRGATPAPAAQTSAPANINYWYWADPIQVQPIADMIKKFNDTHPTIKVQGQLIGWNDYYSTVINGLGAGSPPDALRFKDWWMGEFVKAGALEPLGGYLSAWKGKADVTANLWSLQQYSPTDPLYMLPWIAVYLYLYYRVDWFKEAGLNPPQTLDEFLIAARKLTRAPDRYGFGLRGSRGGHDAWAMLTWPNGLRFADQSGKIILDNDDAVQANQWYLDLYLKEKVAPPSAPADGFNEIVAAFQAGKTAMTVHHVGSSAGLQRVLGDKFAATPMPGGPKGRFSTVAVDYNAITKMSKQKDATFTFISWLAEKEQNDFYATAGSVLPVLDSLKDKYAAINRFYKASTDSIPYAGNYPLIPTLGKWTEMIWPPTMQQALNGQIDSKTTVKTLADGLRG